MNTPRWHPDVEVRKADFLGRYEARMMDAPNFVPTGGSRWMCSTPGSPGWAYQPEVEVRT